MATSGQKIPNILEFMMQPISLQEKYLPIFALEQAILSCPQVEMITEHDFCDGMYARTLKIPSGTILTGAIHKYECFFVVRLGDLIVSTDAEPVQLKAGDMLVSKAGTKRAGIAITDVVVTTFHSNFDNEKDEEKLFLKHTINPDVLVLDGALL